MHRALPSLMLLVACGREPAPEASTAPLTVPSTPSRAAGEALASLDHGRAIHVRVLPAPVDADPGKRHVQDGPHPDAKEHLAGYFIIDVPDLEVALRWAAKAPCVSRGSVEVRPILPPQPQG